MKDYHINIFYSDEDEGYIADIPDLETCSGFGSTAEDLIVDGPQFRFDGPGPIISHFSMPCSKVSWRRTVVA